jgi:uncharacterized protein YciI
VGVFVVIEVSGPNWDSSRARREQDGWDEHAAFMDALVDDGFVVLGGPLGEGERVMVVVEEEDEDEVRRRFAQDPWLPAGILEIASIEPWTIWLDARKT